MKTWTFLKRGWAALMLLLALTACQGGAATPPAPQPTAPPVVILSATAGTATPTPFLPAPPTPTSTPPPSPTPSPTLPPPTPTAAAAARTRYEIHLQLDYSARLAEVEERIHYVNHSQTPLHELVLEVAAGRWPGAFVLSSLTLDGNAPPSYLLDGRYMKIDLPQPLLPGQSLTVEIDYLLRVPYRTQDDFFGYDGYQLNLVDWYPRVVPYDAAQGWLWHRYWALGEQQAYEQVDFDITLAVSNAPEGLLTAASAPPQPDDPGRYRLEAARNFAFSFSPEFLLSLATVDGVQVYSYYFPDLRFGGRAVTEFAAQAVATYTEAFGPPPHDTLSLVALGANDGMEYSGMAFLPRVFYEEYDGTQHSNLAMLTVHEVAHQWWFEAVGNDQALYPWLDESLATYSERVFYAAQGEEHLFWWWNFRVLWFDPQGVVNGSMYQYGYFRDYVDAVYLRGALFLDALRQRVGDETFAAFLRAYYAAGQGKLMTPDDFFALLNTFTEADYSDILATYFAP